METDPATDFPSRLNVQLAHRVPTFLTRASLAAAGKATMRVSWVFAALAVAFFLSACMQSAGETVSIDSTLHKVTATSVEDPAVGRASANRSNGQLRILVQVNVGSGLAAGEHGVHIHANPDCDPGPANATATTNVAAGKAGAHWNPTNAKHGQHAGDLGNIAIGGDGSGTLTVTSFVVLLSLERGHAYSVRGHSVVVHAQRDDGATDPSGNSGGRALCAVWYE